MDRKQAINRAKLWLIVAGLAHKKPNYEQAHKLGNIIFGLSRHEEVYTTGFLYDVWCDLYGEGDGFNE